MLVTNAILQDIVAIIFKSRLRYRQISPVPVVVRTGNHRSGYCQARSHRQCRFDVVLQFKSNLMQVNLWMIS